MPVGAQPPKQVVFCLRYEYIYGLNTGAVGLCCVSLNHRALTMTKSIKLPAFINKEIINTFWMKYVATENYGLKTLKLVI